MKTNPRVIVCGGRDYNDRETLFFELDCLSKEHGKFEVLIHGDQTGADTLAGEWARLVGVKVIACPANWLDHGIKAGPIRNRFMLSEHRPDLVIAFPGDKGTKNMVSQASSPKYRRAGVEVIKIP